jgi:hypothetical protein
VSEDHVYPRPTLASLRVGAPVCGEGAPLPSTPFPKRSLQPGGAPGRPERQGRGRAPSLDPQSWRSILSTPNASL